MQPKAVTSGSDEFIYSSHQCLYYINMQAALPSGNYSLDLYISFKLLIFFQFLFLLQKGPLLTDMWFNSM